MSAFSRGFASVLSAYGSSDRDELRFEYAGRNLESESVDEALTSDWNCLTGTIIAVDVCDDDE